MNRIMMLFMSCGLGIFASGCQSPAFIYHAQPARFCTNGPSILVMPLQDVRTDRQMDSVFAKGYLLSIQQAIGNELASAELFRSVVVITNTSELPMSDIRFSPRLTRLSWEVPDYDDLLAKTVFLSFFTGGIGGGIYISTDTDVYGYAGLDIQMISTSKTSSPLNLSYTVSVTNRMAKAYSDTDSTKAAMTVQAFEKLVGPMKADLRTLSTNRNFSASSETK